MEDVLGYISGSKPEGMHTVTLIRKCQTVFKVDTPTNSGDERSPVFFSSLTTELNRP